MSQQLHSKPEMMEDIADPSQKERLARAERRAARRADREPGLRWVGGFLLIGLGVLFLLQNQGYLNDFSNWWALFLLLPAAGALSTALRTYRRDGATWSKEALGPLAAAVLLAALTAVFLFNLNLSIFGPLLLIAAGLLVAFGQR